MKMILGRAVAALALALGPSALAQSKGESVSKGGGYTKGGDSKGGSDLEGFTVPEPGTLALLGLGLAGIAIARRRRK